jgi:uncharacterized membrane protein
VENLFYALICFFAALGFGLAFYIYLKKHTKKPIVCPLKGHCDSVVHSEYSKLLGVPLEILGMFYYLIIFISYGVFIFLSDIRAHNFFALGVVFITGIAFFFSLYLTAIQALVLKAWCTWCLGSAVLCTLIFLGVVQLSFFDMMPYLIEHRQLILGIHLAGVVIGFGGAIIADLFFAKYLKDFRISVQEAEVLKTLSHIIWLGLAVIFIGGLFLFLTDVDKYINSPKFLVKMIVVAIVAVNGFFLNTLIAPKLTSIPFEGKISDLDADRREDRKLAFALGAISTISWWTAFTLGIMKTSPAPFITMLAAYFLLLFAAVCISQMLEKFLSGKKMPVSET